MMATVVINASAYSIIVMIFNLGTPMESYRAATAPGNAKVTTRVPSVHRLLQASRRPSRLFTTQRGPTPAWASEMETVASFCMMQSHRTLRGPKLKMTTQVPRRRGSMTVIPTPHPPMRLIQASTFGPRTSRVWTTTPRL